MKLVSTEPIDESLIIYEGVFAGRIDIRVEYPTDGDFNVRVYADDDLVGTLHAYEDIAMRITDEEMKFDDVIDEFLQLANVGR